MFPKDFSFWKIEFYFVTSVFTFVFMEATAPFQSVLETFGIATTLNTMKKNFIEPALLQNFKNFAILAISQQTASLRTLFNNLDTIPVQQLVKNLTALQLYISFFDTLKRELTENNSEDFKDFETVFATYYQLLLTIESVLEQSTKPHFSYLSSHKALAADWDNEADDHWNNC